MRLQGKRAVVTGASTGIGRAVARALAMAGASVVVSYRRTHAEAETCVAEIRDAGGVAHAVQADVTNLEDIARLVEAAANLLGGIDTWVNFAGADILTGAGAELDDCTKLQQLISTDLCGTIHCCWAAAPYLAAQTTGSIINASWDQALTGMGGRNPEMFAAVKGGVTGFTRALARSLAPKIRVNEIAPGWIATLFAERAMNPEYRAQVIADTPLARFGTPQDVAYAAVYLASNEASFVTGQTLMVNGGLVS